MYKEKLIKTDILCFECKKDFGIDCAGRKKNESTRCQKCFKKYMKQLQKEDIAHKEKYLKEKLIQFFNQSLLLKNFAISVKYKRNQYCFDISGDLNQSQRKQLRSWFLNLPSDIKYNYSYLI